MFYYEMNLEEISKLSAIEKCLHKIWKVRLDGYEEILKLFQQQYDEESGEFLKYAGLLEEFADCNETAREKGLTAILYFVENAACAPSTVKGVMSGLVSKCFSSTKKKTRELSLKIVLMYAEVGEKNAVLEQLIEGLENKSPKVVVTSLVAVREVIHAFGPRDISIEPLIRVLRRLLEDRDSSIREESKWLCVEMGRWIGDDFLIQLQSVRPNILAEVKRALQNTASIPVPTRYEKSLQKNQVVVHDSMTAVGVLSLLPKDFYEKCGAEKWRDRQEVLETLLQLTTKVRLESGNYGDLVRMLNNLIAEDRNISVVTLAIKCLTNLVLGLQTRIQIHASACIPTIFDKFKVNNQRVVVALREAIDAIYGITSFDIMLEDIQSALKSENPQVKAETCAFLTRCFYTCSAAQLNMKLLRYFTQCLLNTINDAHGMVRERSAEALGTAFKVAGKRITSPFLRELTARKMEKVKYYYDRAVVTAKTETITGNKLLALSKQLPSNQSMVSTREVKSKLDYVPQSAASCCNVNPKSADVSERKEFPDAFALVKEILTGEQFWQISEFISSEVMEGVSSTNRKERLYFVEKFSKKIQQLEKSFIPANSCIQILAKEPGFKDDDSKILKLRFDTLVYIAENAKISRVAVDSCLFDIANRIGDTQAGAHAASALNVLSQATSLEYISLEVLKIVFSQKNPKNQADALLWLSTAIKQFGLQIQVEEVTERMKEAFFSDRAVVRSAALVLSGAMHTYAGKFLSTFFR